MAKTNYNFAKRQRDLSKEQRKEEKLQRKKNAEDEKLGSLNPDTKGEVATDHSETPRDPD